MTNTSNNMDQQISYVFGSITFNSVKFIDGYRLQTKQIEKKTIEFKGFGKISKQRSPEYDHQKPELRHQILAMLNSEGGKILLGVAKNGVILGGDYSTTDKEYLQHFLKNLTHELKIAGYGLIDDPEFIEIPYEFVSTLSNAPNTTRYLVILTIYQSHIPIPNSKGLYPVRDSGGVSEINYDCWLLRRRREQQKMNNCKDNINFMKKNNQNQSLLDENIRRVCNDENIRRVCNDENNRRVCNDENNRSKNLLDENNKCNHLHNNSLSKSPITKPIMSYAQVVKAN